MMIINLIMYSRKPVLMVATWFMIINGHYR
jgi:hypothetical protein